MKKFVAALVACTVLSGAAYADGTLDGIIGGAYGAPYATDAAGDASNGHAILDCVNLYLYDSGPGSDVFIAMTVSGNVSSPTDWGKYMFFIEANTTAPKAGIGNGNGWNRPIQADGTNLQPNFWLGSWVDSGGGWNFYRFHSGTTWNELYASYSTTGGAGMAWTAGTPSTIEFRIPRAFFGTPLATQIKVVGMSSGGGGGDNAQDSVPNSTPSPALNQAPTGSWGSMVTMTQSVPLFWVPVTVSGFSID